MNELEFHRRLALTVIATGVVVFVSLFWINAPYGRHTRSGWGPSVSSRLGWMLMESPAALGFAAVYARGEKASSAVPLFFCLLWLTHYTYRAFVYPLRLRDAKKPMPLAITAMAIVFNVINPYLNARWISSLGSYSSSWFSDPRCLIGVSAFVAGIVINIHSDNILLALRKPGERDYKVPEGGAFRWVSSPNYFGELIEWAGWALATWSLAGLAFFCFTLANLLPRALAHHRWYHRTFADYPKARRAIIPWLW
jgi:protein-S-isoprenylcysteine O-methyltransferase Ste14